MSTDNTINVFDPKWYKDAFDKFGSVADQLSAQNNIIDQGYHIPDADGSKSSIFRNDAVLNNSFNEDILKESLKEIYDNSSHKLVASNHDSVGFFQWTGHMSDMVYIANTNLCEVRIPWGNVFVSAKERDKYKLSQFYRNWIKVEDILNNWDTFKWHIMLFINKKVYSEYEIRMDDQEVAIRFQYNQYWVDKNHPIYIYKFNTNSQCRVLVSRELCENQWNWKMPLNYVKDKRIANASNVIVAFNRISDSSIRTDGKTKIEVLGDNLEFFNIKDGYIDMSTISNFNRSYVQSELKEWLWMSIIVPKFFHEYPILLPVDSVYRPYRANLYPVTTIETDEVKMVKTNFSKDNQRQVYVDLNGDIQDEYNGWKQMIRPIVLSDAFEISNGEPNDAVLDEILHLRDLTVLGADIIEEFRFFIKDETVTETKLNKFLDDIVSRMTDIYDAYKAFLDKKLIDQITEYENIFDRIFIPAVKDIRETGEESIWFHPSRNSDDTFWSITSPLIIIPRELADRYTAVEIINSMDRKNIWEDVNTFKGKVRFQRPIEEHDFWMFEYDSSTKVWRPNPIKIARHFPDVYLPKYPSEATVDYNRIFKAFFFYNDTMNVLEESRDIKNATPKWDEDTSEYYYNPSAIYRDIFMEKFYWMGIRAIYKGLLATNYRWEILEYVVDNTSYKRFNELFINTMDPYFKLGLATYLKSSNFEFPFDDAIAKLEESMNLDHNGYKKISNFEVYLNKSWIPSYFDYIVKIIDDWDYGNRLIKRPPNTFDMRRLQPAIIEVQTEIIDITKEVFENLEWVIKQLKEETYNIDVEKIASLYVSIQELLNDMKVTLEFITKLDLNIASIKDINYIIDNLKKYSVSVEKINSLVNGVKSDVETNNIYQHKRTVVNLVEDSLNEIPSYIDKILSITQSFNMDGFMKSINDLNSYFDHAKTNPNDNSLLGQINKFNDPWTASVKEKRNSIFISTSILYGTFDPNKSYSNEEVTKFVVLVDKVKEDIIKFRSEVESFWQTKGLQKDQIVIDRLDHTEDLISKFNINMKEYYDARNALVDKVNQTIHIFDQLSVYRISKTEEGYKQGVTSNLESVIAALSYIAGSNHKEDAEKSLQAAHAAVQLWLGFITKEESVFDILFAIVKQPSQFLTIMNDNLEIVASLIEYMDTVNFPFIPDKALPTYSDVYEIDTVEIDYKGFRYTVGDIVFVPNLGSYKIVSIEGKIARVKYIEDAGFRKTIFRDPMVQVRSYDTISSGVGVGLTLKPISSKRTRIINDEVVKPIIAKVKNTLSNISRFIIMPNSHNNTEFNNTLDGIIKIQSDWNGILNAFADYTTEEIRYNINNLFDTLVGVIPISKTFMENRSKIQPQEFSIKLEEFIHEVYSHITDTNQQNEEFFYYDNQTRIVHNELLIFLDSGTSWMDSEYLKKLLFECKGIIKTYNSRVISNLQSSDKLTEIEAHIDSLYSMIADNNTAISNLPGLATPIQSVLNHVDLDLSTIPSDFHKDVWYKIDKVLPAISGWGYQRGDIIEIIPQLPIKTGQDLSKEMKNIILNDKIFLQVMEVDNGKVIKIQPIMNYAIPYLIWGIRNTITHTGKGNGLTVDVFSNEITIKDSTLLRDQNTFIPNPNPFNESDLLAFKFENIHDLNINYEIFFGGKQITNFFQTHEDNTNHLHSGKIDVLYVNANEVMGLKNSSIHIPGEQYFIYKINNVSIKDPGAGYCVGQDIFVDANQLALRLKVAKLVYSPYKGIDKVILGAGNIIHGTVNPSTVDAEASSDTMNNIDDELHVSYYDTIPKEGINKPATLSYPQEEYEFTSKRFDNMDGDNRNSTFMYPDINMIDVDPSVTNGDPDQHWYQGSRIDNSQHPMKDSRRWNGIMNLNPPTDPFIPDACRLPLGKPVKGEYQMFDRLRIHNSENTINGDLEVETFADLPKHTHDWADGKVGKTVIVKCDETNDGHRMLYRIRTFVVTGFFVYNLPEIADRTWNSIHVDWMNSDYHPDYPSIKEQYPTAPWKTVKSYRAIQEGISDKKYQRENVPVTVNTTSYIHQVTLDDLSVFNWTTKQWENLHDEARWKLDTQDDPANNKWGFTLTFLQEGLYSYDMKFYWNKIPDTQLKNANLRRNAVMDISAVIIGEVNIPAISMSVNTARTIRIRKLFPYEQKESFTIGYSPKGDPLGYEMDFKLAPYMHYKNEIHLQDIKIFNKTANRFEDILDRKMFEVRFKDSKAVSRGYETQTTMVSSVIGNAGEDFIDGEVWGWNEEFGIHIFGRVTAAFRTNGHLLTFTPTHCPNPPKENITLEFQVYQRETQTDLQTAMVLVEFKTERLEVHGDGYIHNVSNPLAPIPKEIKIIAQYNLDSPYEYDVVINKTPNKWTFIDPNWMMIPTFKIPKYNISQNRLYIMTSNGRFPLINPSTGKPSLTSKETEDGTEVTFMNLYRRFEHLEIRSVPYPMRSVYVKRRIPSHGFIDLCGKINKPLNKKYFEFWVNGRLLNDEVTIISPTKIFLHGLQSLKNLEIVEINRDSNEYFSDIFLEQKESKGRPFPFWDYKTYLDAALEGDLEKDNYSLEEQEYLLTPVWKQVDKNHPFFKDYPPNVDNEADILQRVQANDVLSISSEAASFEFMMVDTPTLEGIPLTGRKMNFEQFGWRPMSDEAIVQLLNKEWENEIKNNPYFHEHIIIDDDEWYGTTARLYDEYGILVHTLNESVYQIADPNVLKINSSNKLSKIIRKDVSYDLS